jgi:hypothetical protein
MSNKINDPAFKAAIDQAFANLLRSAGIVNAPNFSLFDILSSGSGTSTSAPITLYVDSTLGNDNAAGTVSQPLATVQAALNLIPKVILHPVKIVVAAGNYAGFYVQGFRFDNSANPTLGAFLSISGTLAAATVATGTTSGTATGGTAGTGSSSTFGTLVDSGQTWTSSDLRGKFVKITGGTGVGQIFPIHDNTSTTITVCGSWTAPTGTSTYSIVSPATLINTNVNAPPTASGAAAFARAGVVLGGNVGMYPGVGDVFLEQLGWTNSAAAAVVNVGGPFEVYIRHCNFAQTGAKTLQSQGNGSFRVVRCSATVPATVSFFEFNTPAVGMFARIDNTVIDGGARGLVAQGGELALNQNSFKNQTVCAVGIGFLAVGRSGISVESFGNIMDTCVKGFDFNVATAFPTGALYSAGGYLVSNNDNIKNCSTAGIDILGSNFASVVGTVGTGNGIGMRIAKGASVQVDSSSTLTGSTEVSIDGAASALATMRGATPKVVKDTNYFSKFFE